MVVIGVGADGWDGLGSTARTALAEAELVLGSERQLRLLPAGLPAERRPWPSPMLPALPGLLAERHRRRLVVLASGDPMFYGIGGTLVRLLGAGSVRIIAQVSSLSLAAARLGWPLEEVEVLSVLGRPLAALHPLLQPGRRVLVLLGSAAEAAGVAGLLRERGLGPSELVLLCELGGAGERLMRASAESWPGQPDEPLAVLAIEVLAAPGAALLPASPGLPDAAFDHDGQLTKSEVRAITVAALAPVAGQLLWDVGAGSGSVGIEWMRSHPSCRAVAIEARPDRLERVAANAQALGVPGLRLVAGRAPQALAGLPVPDAVFVGGGVSRPGVLEACEAALAPGGRLVANAVTVEAEAVLADWYRRRGGRLIRIAVQRAEPVGGFTGWRPAMPVTQWSYTRATP
ncbi:precorrin-6y C5,15-methyltransferase (decarboxylating) subunit CbiE [Jatrophihabitans sp.]|uniref:precorrin-6y C5,15-methyltransferase (decarboxylating) subunit CbiE n=1 Tax=Jatrophihabitans sp. TaxID=1932789 RepID=UPI0038CD3D4F